MSHLNFENYRLQYQEGNPNSSINKCWRSFRKRIIQRGGYADDFDKFKCQFMTHNKNSNEITAWNHFLGGASENPCYKVGHPVLYNKTSGDDEKPTYHLAILLARQADTCDILLVDSPLDLQTQNVKPTFTVEKGVNCHNIFTVTKHEVTSITGDKKDLVNDEY